jgi:DNA (cytosine-5)-methyltransferase 1
MGLDLGLEKAGFNIKVSVEADKHACATIRANTNIPVIEKDINNVSTEEILEVAGLRKEEVFLVAGGPPCQAFSTAGARRGLSDFRGNVIINFLRIVKEIRPKFFIMENVRGLLSSKIHELPEEYGSEYDDVLGIPGSVMYFLAKEFEKYGYTISFTLFNSANYGVPQKRERVIVFGYYGNKRIPLPSPTHSETGKETGKKWVTFGQAIEGLKEEEMNYLELSEKHKRYLKMLKGGENWRNLPPDVVEEAMGGSYKLGGGKTGFYRRLSYDEPSPTLVTSPTMPATMLAHPEKLRPLSAEEYRRIQQFPDDWVFSGGIREIYKQIGNAVPVGLGYMAGKTIMDFYHGNYDPEREIKNLVPYSRYKNCSDFEFFPEFQKRVAQAMEKRKEQKNRENEFKQLELFSV